MNGVLKQMNALALLVTICGLLALSPPLAAESFDRGRELYQNHCMSCHESWAHERAGRRVASLQALRQRVAGWSIHTGLNWGDEEIHDVADYLNRNFYQLTR